MNRQHKGTASIQQLWAAIPATRHPDLATEAHKYVIECNPISGLTDPSGANPGGVDGLMLTVHGEFEEPNPTPDVPIEKALRSFSRTFILGPGIPGGNPIRVVSDLMVLRPWSPIATPSTSTSQEIPVVEPVVPVPPANIGDGLTDQQRQEAMAIQLMERTGMTLQYAALCLTETGWDIEQAFIAFQANKVCRMSQNEKMGS
jgi:nuclear RNA export factor